jgi:hypothetical protein
VTVCRSGETGALGECCRQQGASTGARSVAGSVAGVREAVTRAGSGAGDVLTAAIGLADQSRLLSEEVSRTVLEIRAACLGRLPCSLRQFHYQVEGRMNYSAASASIFRSFRFR